MAKSGTTNGRTMKWLRERGYTTEVVERWLQATMQRKDLFGVADLLAYKQGYTCLVQCCTTKVREHVETIQRWDGLEEWCKHDREVYLIAWRKLKVKRGGKAVRWVPRLFRAMWNPLEVEYRMKEVEALP